MHRISKFGLGLAGLAGLGALTWHGDGGPWAKFSLTDVAYNVDVTGYVQARGI